MPARVSSMRRLLFLPREASSCFVANMPATRERTNPKNGNDNRRGELVRAAAQLFREKGFEGTTVRDIANAVGMQSGSPFYHFGSKVEMLVAVMEEGLRQGLA